MDHEIVNDFLIIAHMLYIKINIDLSGKLPVMTPQACVISKNYKKDLRRLKNIIRESIREITLVRVVQSIEYLEEKYG